MNRAQRRAASRAGQLCEHGHAKKTDGNGRPLCPHGCGFPHSQRHDQRHDDKLTFREFLRQQTADAVDYRGRGA